MRLVTWMPYRAASATLCVAGDHCWCLLPMQEQSHCPASDCFVFQGVDSFAKAASNRMVLTGAASAALDRILEGQPAPHTKHLRGYQSKAKMKRPNYWAGFIADGKLRLARVMSPSLHVTKLSCVLNVPLSFSSSITARGDFSGPDLPLRLHHFLNDIPLSRPIYVWPWPRSVDQSQGRTCASIFQPRQRPDTLSI